MTSFVFENPDQGLTVTFDVNGDFIEVLYDLAEFEVVEKVNVTDLFIAQRSKYSAIQRPLQTVAQKRWLNMVDDWFTTAKYLALESERAG